MEMRRRSFLPNLTVFSAFLIKIVLCSTPIDYQRANLTNVTTDFPAITDVISPYPGNVSDPFMDLDNPSLSIPYKWLSLLSLVAFLAMLGGKYFYSHNKKGKKQDREKIIKRESVYKNENNSMVSFTISVNPSS
ncbi:hypothetical protein JTE90_025026 [Oedothorax gibbosus]|uniref:Uncharacterized protein n=1 Tax=Oedothorax gibbosus TaxID=931172 RepID=A0AAV6U541_9ARAC|nr:hypothetical protein JTE90_025026 [Oedothorax gibbosus]